MPVETRVVNLDPRGRQVIPAPAELLTPACVVEHEQAMVERR